MPGKAKKLTNMVWRTMGEAILLSLCLFGLMIYMLNFYGFLRPFTDWWEGIWVSTVLIGAVAMIGAAAGYIHSRKFQGRLERLREAMIWLEKGNLSRAIPALGDDEVGRLGGQLERISKKWEDQVTTLQRLSTNNAELAEKVRANAVIEERQRLARELHDAVSQQLFAISMTATAVGRTLEKDFERAKRQIALIEEMAAVAQSEMRALLLHLRPVNLEGRSLSAGLHKLLEELQAKVPIEISAEIEDNIFLPKGIEDHLFRIAQEALSNTLRHSRATKMEVRLHKKDDTVRLSVRDNGVGFDLNIRKQASYGLTTMQERVNEVGGSINIVSAPGKGTRVDIRIPIMSNEGEEDSGRGQSN